MDDQWVAALGWMVGMVMITIVAIVLDRNEQEDDDN